VSPDGKALAAAAVSGRAAVRRELRQALHELPGHGFAYHAAVWQPAAPSRHRRPGRHGGLWDTSTGAEAKALAGGAAWAKNSQERRRRLIAVGDGRKVRVWDAAGI